ncbi:MAG: isopentenyl-diphosphate delta-isomerase [Candidatus Marinimicrobia bacterium]|nr:isopentenyl-diphosphate delta-isomerase [Candidatus Neomarinimicrobiota bacterium]|tara:strand:- start:6032 stop:6565 length:534 start_codon:yes stop_codon:yes gene_type:complete
MEKVVLVNKDNKKLGVEDKLVAHQKGLLHRAFSIIIYNQKREILLQRRSLNKYHTPNLWTNTCCSHPFENENYDDAINRRLYEEMGMKCKLDEYYSFIYKTNLENNLIEFEHDTVFIGQTNNLPIINDSEVSEYKYINYELLKNNINIFPNEFTPWFKLIFNQLDESFFNYKNYYYV